MKQATALIFLALTALTLSGCVSLERSSASGYEGRDGDLGVSRDRQQADREASAQDLGYYGNRPLSERESADVETRTALRKAEHELQGHRERDQYYKNKPYMHNDRERLAFLKLDSFEARQKWLSAHGIQGAATPNPPEIQGLVDANDITTGMTKEAVRQSWGEPELVEVAGNPIYGNERWHYTEQLPSTEGYLTEHRLVYFESGRVVGWEKK